MCYSLTPHASVAKWLCRPKQALLWNSFCWMSEIQYAVDMLLHELQLLLRQPVWIGRGRNEEWNKCCIDKKAASNM